MPYLSPKQRAGISFTLKIILTFLAVVAFINLDFVWFIIIVLSLIMTNIPAILQRDFFVKLPIIFDFAITLSVFLHTVGAYVDWYENIPFYDNLTHFISSMTVSLIGVTLLYLMVTQSERTTLPPLFFGFFTVLFAMSMGVVWEFLEWGTDLLIGTDTQRGLENTMRDLLFDTIAGIIVGAVATGQLKAGEMFEGEDIVIGDIKNSAGYQRWKMLTDKNVDLKEKIRRSFKDPLILEQFFDYIVKESKDISEAELEFWEDLKKRLKRKNKEQL